MLALAYTEGDKGNGTFDWNAAQFGSGLKYASTVVYDITEADGVLSIDEEAGTDIPVATTDFADFRAKTMIAANGAATKELLEDAYLAKSEDGTIFKYTPSFDKGALAEVISSFVGLTFKQFLTDEYLPYLESTITLLEGGDIGMELLCRSKFDEAGLYTGYQGYIVRIHNVGETSLDLSKSFAENFGIEITPESEPAGAE